VRLANEQYDFDDRNGSRDSQSTDCQNEANKRMTLVLLLNKSPEKQAYYILVNFASVAAIVWA
jgi:hypothetical protein